MATLSLNTSAIHSPSSRQPWSPLASPVCSSANDSLSARCRALAFKFGHDAVQDDPAFDHDEQLPSTSPNRSSPTHSPSRRTASSPHFSPLVSPRSSHRDLHPPPTPEGSFVLDEIIEEEVDTPRQEVTSLQLGDRLEVGGQEAKQEGAYGTSAAADDELSYNSAQSGSRKHSFTGGFRAFQEEQAQQQEMVDATVEEETVALRQQLKDGSTWVGADIWLVDGELLVGPHQEALDPSRAFSSVFVEPILEVFQNSVVPVGTAHRRRSSVFAHISLQTPFQLILRLHTAPSITFPYVADALQPLHDASLLTTYCPNACNTTPALITVVSSSANGAEMVPLEDLTSVVGPRFVYRDADISALEDDEQLEQLDNEITPVAAGRLKEATGWDGQSTLTEEQRERIKRQVERAHKKQIKVRYEGLPQFPVHVRENVKTTLLGLGVDYL
ncbi:hypothetical protein JCM8547_004866 [Rhodosporidiobolus lusitaniae]